MAKKHLEGLEHRVINGAMTLDGKFVVKNGFRAKKGKAIDLTQEEINKANGIEIQKEVNEEVKKVEEKELGEDEPIV